MASKFRFIGRWVWRVAVVLLVIGLIQREPERHLRINPKRMGPSGSFVFDLFPKVLQFLDPNSWAMNLGQNFPPHGYMNSNAMSGTLAASSSTSFLTLQLPTPADQALAVEETYEAWVNNTANGTAATTYLNQGVSNPQVGTSCPQFPYIGVAHAFGPGLLTAPINPGSAAFTFLSPANGGGHAETRRLDAIVYNGSYGCGGSVAINTCSFVSGTSTVTCNVGVNPFGNGQFIQITGSNTVGDNTVGGQTFQLTASSGTSFSFVDAAGAACGSGCGTASWPYIAGSPPYNMLAGAGSCGTTNQPCLSADLEQGSSQPTVSYSFLETYIAVPLVACLYSNGCGIGNAFQ